MGGQRLADRGAVGSPQHPHRPVVAAADDDRGAVRQRPGRHRTYPTRTYPAGVGRDDLVASGLATVGPAGLPGPAGGGVGDAGGQAAAAEVVGGQFELAGPHGRVEAGEEVGALPVHGGGGPGRGRSSGIEVGHQPSRIGDEQKPRILEQVVQLAGLGGVQREVSPCVTVPAQRVGGGVGRDDRVMGLGRVDQEVGVLLRVDQEVREGLVVHAKRAIGGRAVQELAGRARHLPDGGTAHRLLAQPASHQPELLSGEARVLGDGKRGENGPNRVDQARSSRHSSRRRKSR